VAAPLGSKCISSKPRLPPASFIQSGSLPGVLTENIIPRYDQPATAALPILYTTNYTPGQKGLELNLEAALFAIQEALRSPSVRIVQLPVK